MKVSKSVQFRSAEQVLEAYENRDVPAFAIWQDKQFLYKYEGDSIEEGTALLERWIEMIQSNQSSSIYTVCVYEDLAPGTKIKDNTPYDGSFNFRLFDQASGYLPPVQYAQYQQHGGNLKLLLDKLSAQQIEIDRLKQVIEAAPDDDDDDQDDGLGIVGKLISHPTLGPAIQPLLERLSHGVADLIVGKEQPAQQPANNMRMQKVSGVNDQKLIEVLERLQQHVEDLPALLEKLALIAERQPKQFALYKSMLNSMQV